MALLSTEGKFSCLKSAENIEKVSHDKLTRFLSCFEQKQEIEKNSKGEVLLTALAKGFSKAEELGGNRKAIILPEGILFKED